MFSNASHFVIGNGNFYSTNVIEKRSTGLELLRKVACISATHDSSSRVPPKCDPNTRQALVSHLISWLDASSTTNCKLLWLNGAAGVGKSAVAQTFSEHCEKTGDLLATFFFARDVEGRKDHTTLISTLAYQVAVRVPAARAYIDEVLENDPSIFEKSLLSQMDALIVSPLNAVASCSPNEISPRRGLIIIDGLDECEHSPIQDKIVEAAGVAVKRSGYPLSILIASRRHFHIEDVFSSNDFIHITRCVSLDQWSASDDDMKIFLRKELESIRQRFPHNPILRQAKPGTWPSDHYIRMLLRKASGQFIYASTVVKFLADRHYNPVERLDAIVLGKPITQSPFGELDSLYSRILNDIPKECIQTTMKVLGLVSELRNQPPSLIEDLLGLRHGDVALALCDLTPLLSITESDGTRDNHDKEIIQIHHASFLEYLFNEGNTNRNPDFAISRCQVRTDIACGCLRIMAPASENEMLNPQAPTLRFAIRYWAYYCALSVRPCPELLGLLWQFDLDTWMKSMILNHSLLTKGFNQLEGVMKWLLPDQQDSSDHLATNVHRLFSHKQDARFFALLETCPDHSLILNIFALLEVCASPLRPDDIKDLLSVSGGQQVRVVVSCVRPLLRDLKDRSIWLKNETFHHFLRDEERSHQFFLSDKVYNQVALRCQEFLLNAAERKDDESYRLEYQRETAQAVLEKLHERGYLKK